MLFCIALKIEVALQWSHTTLCILLADRRSISRMLYAHCPHWQVAAIVVYNLKQLYNHFTLEVLMCFVHLPFLDPHHLWQCK